jgi:methionyl-tRNA formyltransferase
MVFLGTPLFATHSLRALVRLAERGVLDLAAVVTRADKPGSRGRSSPRPVGDLAREVGLPVHTDFESVRRIGPELLVWAAFGRKIPEDLLAVRYGGVNVHASLLPRWRGPAPIQAAILAGDDETGVTLMRAETAIDTGPVLDSRPTAISPYDDATSLEVRLGELGGELLEAALPAYLAGELVPRPQDESRATWSHRLTTEESELDFTRPARENWRLVRAAVPRPVARTAWKGRPLLVWHARVSDKAEPVEPGRVWLCGDEVCVDTPENLFVPQIVQPAGKRKMSAPEWARGARLAPDARLPS